MSYASRRLAGILLIVLPTVMYGGVSLLQFLINDPQDATEPNGFINLAWVGAVVLAIGVLALGIGLVRKAV